jgi:hypothetical protein
LLRTEKSKMSRNSKFDSPDLKNPLFEALKDSEDVDDEN